MYEVASADKDARLIAVIAMSAGVRVLARIMPEPKRIRNVLAARYASGVTASYPQDSAD